MTQEECIQAQEINATHQRASRKRCALRFVGTAIGKLKVNEVQHHKPPPMEEICQVCQAVKWKDETTNSSSCNGRVMLAQLHDPPQEFKQLNLLLFQLMHKL
jgi:tRNA(Phe) wybutosine-synthesizing methylase Tyw3